jgi:hypothetical protein
MGAGRLAGGSYVAKITDGWYGVERDRAARWAWTATRGSIAIETAPRRLPVRVRLQVRAIAPRDLEIRHEGQVVFRGRLGVQRQWIDLPLLTAPANGVLPLDLYSPTAPVAENAQADARALGFALHAVEVRS